MRPLAIVAALALCPATTAAQSDSGRAAAIGAISVGSDEFGGALVPAKRQFWIWIEPRSSVRGFQRSYPAAVREAFREWQAAELPVDFAFVDDSSHANLFVFWRDRFATPTLGRGTWWTIDGLGFMRGEIELALSPRFGTIVSDGLVRTIALHEIGHLLGLRHRNDPRSIMSREIAVTSLPPGDMRRAQALYRSVLDDERSRATR